MLLLAFFFFDSFQPSPDRPIKFSLLSGDNPPEIKLPYLLPPIIPIEFRPHALPAVITNVFTVIAWPLAMLTLSRVRSPPPPVAVTEPCMPQAATPLS